MPRVLHIDGDFTAQNRIKTYLEEAGLKVTTVDTEKDALTRIRRSKCSVVLIRDREDYLNAFECIENIRKRYPIPILVLGTTRDSEHRIKYLQKGAAQYIQEPCASEELIEIVRVHLRPS
ncbi:MAG: chemotaxis protein CheY [Parcubacteria group bacterium]|nr:chemotaxis protein CheY [Parcubacteria group bacterium]